MFIVTVVVSVLLAVALVGSARGKLVRDERTVTTLAKVGVVDRHLRPLAALEVAGAVGLLVGLLWWPLGVAAAVGVILYFVGAVAFHVRARDTGFAPALVLGLVAAAALALRLATR